MRRAVLRTTLALLLLLLAHTAVGQAAAETLKVGLLMDLTGRAAELGRDIRDGFMLYLQ